MIIVLLQIEVVGLSSDRFAVLGPGVYQKMADNQLVDQRGDGRFAEAQLLGDIDAGNSRLVLNAGQNLLQIGIFNVLLIEDLHVNCLPENTF